MKHKHCELIKAWADGAEIQQFLTGVSGWVSLNTPSWNPDYEFRIKPESKPDIVTYLLGNSDGDWGEYGELPKFIQYKQKYVIKLTFDGETGKILKSAEVLK